ncbi:MAG: hypothetical protein LBG58_04050 [Planctomycetaceae bacterium]|jgi:hypothetical protein|nr:hypothetical protein [Planctomycetaceae bacterium]
MSADAGGDVQVRIVGVECGISWFPCLSFHFFRNLPVADLKTVTDTYYS